MTSPRSRSYKSPTAANYLTADKNNINFPRFIWPLATTSMRASYALRYTGRCENRRRKIRPATQRNRMRIGDSVDGGSMSAFYN